MRRSRAYTAAAVIAMVAAAALLGLPSSAQTPGGGFVPPGKLGGATFACGSGSAAQALDRSGHVTCIAAGGSGGGGGGTGTITGSGSANRITKFTAGSAVGNSSITDDGSNVSIGSAVLTVNETTGNTAVLGALTADSGQRVFDLTGIGLTSSGASVGVIPCSGTQVLAWNSGAGAWGCGSPTTGTVTSIATTAPISGGTITSGGTIGLNIGAGLTTSGSALVSDNTIEQARVSGTCAAPNAILSISSSGTVTCTTGEATTATGTANTLAKYSAGSAIANSGETDDGFTFSVGSKLAITQANGNLVGSGSASFAGSAFADGGNRVIDTVGAGLAQTANSVAVNLASTTCSAGSGLTAISSSGVGTCAADVTAVAAGTGISASTSSGTATVTLNEAGASCSAGSAITAMSATGTGTCTTGLVTNGVANTIPKYSAAGVLNVSVEKDDGTNFSVGSGSAVKIVEASGNTTIGGTLGVTGAFTGSATGAFTGALTADAGNRVLDTAGIGLSQTANQIAMMSCVTVGNYLAWTGSAFACTSAGTTTNAPYGFGIDGPLTFNGSSTVLGITPVSSKYTLTRDIFATTIAISSGVTVNANGFRIFASTSITFASSTAVISNDGGVGGLGSASGGVGGAGGGIGSLGGGNVDGGNDGADGGNSGNPSNPGLGGLDPQGFTGTGGAGGVSDAGGVNAVGGPLSVSGGWGLTELQNFHSFTDGEGGGTPVANWTCGTGGGGGITAAGAGGVGGGGGGGGGCLFVATPSIISTTGSGLIHATGGTGGTGGTGSPGSHGAGGGGGGGGGLVVVETSTLTTAQYTASATGGAGGAPGGSGGTIGTAGAAGGAGRVVVVDPGSPGNGGGTSTGTVTSITCGTGLTGGTITASGTCAIDNTVVQETSSALVSGCGSGSALGAIAANGTPTCVSTGGGLSGTAGALTRWATSSTLGASAATDDGTTLTTGAFAYGEVSQTLGASGTINNYAIGSAGAYYEITTVGTTIITGITNGVPGRRITVYNTAGGPITWNNLSGSSTAANRLTMVAAVSTWVTASGEYIDFVYSGTDSTWHQVQTEHFAAIVDAGALNVGGTLTLSSVVNGTGRFSITNGAAQSSSFSTTTGAQTTAGMTTLGAAMAGSFNTTSAALVETALSGTATSTRSSGSNTLTTVGVFGSASGAQINYAAQWGGGDIDATTGHYVDTGNTAPALTTCGTSPTITGSDIAGTIVTGTGATACTVTWHLSYGSTAPSCIWADAAGASTPPHMYSTGVSATLTLGASHTVEYHCMGH